MNNEARNEKKKDTAKCSVCIREIEDKENAPVLTMGHYGFPRLLCKNCEELINTALGSKDPTEAEAAMARLGETVGDYTAYDQAVLEAMEDIFKTATERAEKIKAGEYDFALDEIERPDDGLDEIPTELLETEEDKAITAGEEEKNKKFNKVMDIITAAVFVAAAALMIWFIISR